MSLEDKITETNLCWPVVIFKTEIKMATGDISVRNKEGLLQAEAFWTQMQVLFNLKVFFVLLHLILLRIVLN